MSAKTKCPSCDGTGWAQRVRAWPCPFCNRGTVIKWSADFDEGRLLSNSDSDSNPVAVSNIRVWREENADTEDRLWRVRYGYGLWIELRADLATIVSDTRELRRYLKRAEGLSLTGLVTVLECIQSLGQYPILDEDDHSQAEHEELMEHWEMYGESDLRRAMVAALPDNWERAITEVESADLSDAYWRVCCDIERYPERIDSSAYDFGTEARRRQEAWAVEPMLEELGFGLVGCDEPGTVARRLPLGDPMRGVLEDIQLTINEGRNREEEA